MSRVLAHAHSLWSYDGRLSLTQWIALARAQQADAVLLAEHEETGWTQDRYERFVEACLAVSTPSLSVVPGIEFNQDGYHVLCYGLRRWPARPCDALSLAAEVHGQGCFLCLAHPPRYRWRYPAALLDVVDAVEVWNSSWVCDGTLGPHPQSLALAAGKTMLVGQDVHKASHLSGLLMDTFSNDVLGDLQTNRFVIRLGRRAWAPDRLQQRRVATTLQLYRTVTLRALLQSYRWMRRQRRAWQRRAA